jgi:DNA-binding NtrC family response regulator
MKTTHDPFSVLIVDDDEDLCRLLKASLPARFSVHVEHSLTEAEKYLTQHHPSLLFLDNSLPDGKGLSFIPGVMKRNEKIKIVMMTADADAGSGIRDQALRQGVCYFIPKPFRLSLVREIVFSVFPAISAA